MWPGRQVTNHKPNAKATRHFLAGFATASLVISIFTSFIPVATAQQFSTAFFSQHGPSLVITTAPQTNYYSNCSDAVTVESRDSKGVATAPGVDIYLTLATTGSATFYSDSACLDPITTAPIWSWANSTTFYYKNPTAGSETITVSYTGYRSAKQTAVTVTPNNFIWTGGGGNTSWSTNGNWSGGVAPGPNDVAVFNGSCVSNCSPTITANISVDGVRMEAGYAGTITVNAGVTIDLGGNGWVQQAGTFNGSTGAITFGGGGFSLTGGTFRAPSTNMNFVWVPSGIWNVNGGTFNANGGTITFGYYAAMYVTPGSGTYNNVIISSNSAFNVASGSEMNITGTLDVYTQAATEPLFSGVINLTGNLTTHDLGFGLVPALSDTSRIKITGAATQTINSSLATIQDIPGIEINKTGGTVTFTGSPVVRGQWIYTAGTVVLPTTLTFTNGNSNGNYAMTPGSLTYTNVTFDLYSAGYSFTGTWNVSGNLYLSNTYTDMTTSYITGGVFDVKKNLVLRNYGVDGTYKVNLSGNTAQTIDATSGSTPYAPWIEVANTAGGVTLSGNVWTSRWVYTSGTLTVTGSTLTFGHSFLNATVLASTLGNSNVYNNIVFNAASTVFPFTGSMKAAAITLTANNGLTVDMPNPGGAYAINVTGALTVGANTTLNRHGCALTYGSLSNSGTINP